METKLRKSIVRQAKRIEKRLGADFVKKDRKLQAKHQKYCSIYEVYDTNCANCHSKKDGNNCPYIIIDEYQTDREVIINSVKANVGDYIFTSRNGEKSICTAEMYAKKFGVKEG